MDPQAEALIRATIHDLANCLSGAQGILDLSDPSQPLSPSERGRLEGVLSDGMTILSRSRHLALGTLPEASLEPGMDWCAELERQLAPLSAIFRCAFELHPSTEALDARWGGELLREYLLGVTRVLLPYVQGGRLQVELGLEGRHWVIQWTPVSTLAESLNPKTQRPRDVTSHWILRLTEGLDAVLSHRDRTAVARVPRP